MSSKSIRSPLLTPGEAKVIRRFEAQKVLTLQDLMSKAKVSHMTVFSALRKWGYHRSFNQNARYYALKETPRFDERGLWRWGVAHFSIHGSLTATLEAWVNESSRGMTAESLTVELGARVQSSLRDLTARGLLVRERLGPQFVYFSGDPVKAPRQREHYVAAWRHQEREESAAGLPHKDTIIEILLQLIERPRSRIENLRRRVARAGYEVSLPEAKAVFAHYELDKKRALSISGDRGLNCPDNRTA